MQGGGEVEKHKCSWIPKVLSTKRGSSSPSAFQQHWTWPPQPQLVTEMLRCCRSLLPALGFLCERGHAVEMLMGTSAASTHHQSTWWPKRPAFCMAGETPDLASCFLLVGSPYTHHVEKNGYMEQEDWESASIKTPPSVSSEGVTHLSWIPILASACPVRLQCALALGGGVTGVHTAHTVHRTPPPCGKQNWIFCLIHLNWNNAFSLFGTHYLVFKKRILLTFCMRKNSAEVKSMLYLLLGYLF